MSRIVRSFVLVAALAIAGCSSSATGSPGTSTSGSSAEASPSIVTGSTPSESTAATSAAATAQAGSPPASPASAASPVASGGGPAASAPAASGGSGSSGEPALAADLCDMLDQATIDRVTGLQVSAGKRLAPPKGYIAACTWAEGRSAGFELSAQTESVIRSEIAHPPAGYKSVKGVGVAAKVKTGTLFYTNIKEVSLIVNEGTYGLVFGLTATTASIAQDVALAKAVH